MFGEKTSRALLDMGAVNLSPQAPFTLTSGKQSPVYVDCRRIIAFPEYRDMMMESGIRLLQQSINLDNIDVIAGGETAGIPFAAFLADRLHKPMAYIRKKPKGFGKNARIEGNIQGSENVLLVEDLATDGGSKIDFLNALEDAGASCQHIFVIFHYGIFKHGIEALKARGVDLHALATWQDILSVAHERYDDGDIKTVKAFLDNPETWKP